jgi:penicillin amidase
MWVKLSSFLVAMSLAAEVAPGLREPVEILRDRWGVPHIYARNQRDLFYAQGYITAKDRLFQLDLWRRTGSGKLAEVLGPPAVARDRIARLVRYRGDWDAEWKSYSPDTQEIATAFVDGINAYIRSLPGKRTAEFQAAGYDPGEWTPEDVVSRIAGLLMTRNAQSEVQRAIDIATHGVEFVTRVQPPDPPVKLEVPKGLDLRAITPQILRDYTAAIGAVRFPGEQGSNNWVVDGTMTVTGKPLLANDPHRPIQLPSLRKTVHLVAPGWNVIGAGEPALPGVALGHNEHIAFGFTIVGIDQQDLYVEKLNPSNANEYWHRGAWRKMDVETDTIAVKGEAPRQVELKYTVHGPVLYEDGAKQLAYALKWVGAEPGGAGYLPALRLARARNWKEFQAGAATYKVPSENLVYADRDGNIGWIASGLAPVRPNWAGLLPVPGDGSYEWSGYLPLSRHPQLYNPAKHFVATANHNILPAGYRHVLGYEWAAPFRFWRVEQLLGEKKKFSAADFARMQQDVLSLPALEWQKLIRDWKPERHAEWVELVRQWDGQLTADSRAGLIFEAWMARLGPAVFGANAGGRGAGLPTLFAELRQRPNPKAVADALDAAVRDIERLVPNPAQRVWGAVHRLELRHPLNRTEFHLPPIATPGDANTVNAASGANFRQTNGPSYRQIIDVSDWDASIMTNVPGEVGDPASPHYRDLLEPWRKGEYHPMPYSRRAVEAATIERLTLTPR